MRCQWLKLSFALLFAVALSGCAGMMSSPQPLTFTPEGFPSGQYLAKADNFQFILDASQTMANNGGANFETAKNFVNAVNWSLPGDLVANAGLRTFGPSEFKSNKMSELVYGMEKYSRDGMKKGLEKANVTGGNSPLGAAISAASADLASATGTSALVIVSDGTQNVMDDAVASAKAAKAAQGDKLCVYTVFVGDDPAGKKYLDSVAAAAAGNCGFAENAAAMTDQKALAAFVEKVFLKKKPAPIPVAAPAPPPPPPPAPAPAPAPMVKEIITFNLLFDFDKAVIKDEFIPVLEQAKKILNEDPTATYVIAGHTCNIGTDAYNQKLSERRAAAVKNWLTSNGIAADRLETMGYGESQPKYDNKTEEGRKMNRRVEIQTK